MKITSTAEMRAIDRATSERFGVPSLTLMENAGSAVSRFVFSDYPRAERIGVVCGKGNNGGDGFVIARKLAQGKLTVRVLLLCDPVDLHGDAAAMFEKMLDRTEIAPLVVREPEELESSEVAEILASDVIVDAVLGTGFRSPVSPLYAAAIAKMNASGAAIVAVDIPSGVDADAMITQQGTVARADAVITFTAPRRAHVLAGLTNGPIMIAAIGSPREAVVSESKLNLSTPADFTGLLAPRARDANKGSYGHVLVIGGSLGKAGAAAMAGFSALRAGAGLSTVATARSAQATVAGFHPELMTELLPETEDGTISPRAIGPPLNALLERKTVIAIGPGISRNRETSEFVRAVVTKETVSPGAVLVLDADALNAFEGVADQLNGRGRSIVITPHPGEMARLTGLTIAAIQANRLEIARKFASEHEVIVALKGHRTLVAAPDGTVWVNSTGNPGMATGGTGDILTGMISGLVAQHPEEVLEATALAVYLHGVAGDLAAAVVGESSLVATDLVRFLPEAFARARTHDAGDFRMHT
jgi:ADP-dependent NAD(P)H-hydrate dehydratase / NAD(P)H-hydrate epimerase